MKELKQDTCSIILKSIMGEKTHDYLCAIETIVLQVVPKHTHVNYIERNTLLV
jgi:hypothetical protein